MKKIFGFLLGLTLLTGCAESLALLGPTSTAVTGGNIAQSALSSAVNYSVKKQTGKSPMEHAVTYAEEMNPQKKKEPCLSFVEKTNSEICAIVNKQLAQSILLCGPRGVDKPLVHVFLLKQSIA